MRILYTILLIGLFILGYFLCKSYLCDQASEIQAANALPVVSDQCRTRLVFKDGDEFQLKSEENFKFKNSSFDIMPPGAVLSENINLVVGYLNEHPDRIMQIKGLYTSEESPVDNYKTLGHARAYAIQSFLIEQGVAADQLSVLGKRTKQNCFKEDILQKGMSAAFGQKK